MTNEYEPGSEDIFLTVAARPDGNVSLGIHLVSTKAKVYGVVLSPEVARNAAQNLTLASWGAEELKQWQDNQEEGS